MSSLRISFAVVFGLLTGSACAGLSLPSMSSSSSSPAPAAADPSASAVADGGGGGGGGGGSTNLSCCVNGAFYACPDAGAVDRCSGEFSRCTMSCMSSDDPACVENCPAPDPSACSRDAGQDATCPG
ncbi:MAG: hypothetical protein H6709_06540 [Kofleriaceae bacterium]|nr:hypothetical protein [Myxococcales bacterium]MCB9560337.1 hypothetical protein [Kofleriaceae bacterium]MCB9571733.1 hypothetical protein [Kofleriaceae bacterium]